MHGFVRQASVTTGSNIPIITELGRPNCLPDTHTHTHTHAHAHTHMLLLITTYPLTSERFTVHLESIIPVENKQTNKKINPFEEN